MWTRGKLPTIEDSLWRSLCRPSPRAARCSRIREVLADDGHGEVAAVRAAERGRQRVAEVSGRVGAPAHLGEHRLPLAVRHPAVLPVRPGVLPAMVEELHVLALEGLDLRLDEGVELFELLEDVVGDREVHAASPGRILHASRNFSRPRS
jgi:hypothetical protein